MDFGCYVDVSNRCKSSLMLKEKRKSGRSTWEVEPPSTIKAGKSHEFVLKDSLGLEGTEGAVVYTLDSLKNPDLELEFSCPAKPGSKNTFIARSSHESIMKVEKDGPTEGHPMKGKDLPSKFLLSTLPDV